MLVGEKTPNGPIQRANAHFLISRSLPFLARFVISLRRDRCRKLEVLRTLTQARARALGSVRHAAAPCRLSVARIARNL